MRESYRESEIRFKRCLTNRKDRAIAGLSIGGGQTISIGLSNLEYIRNRWSWLNRIYSLCYQILNMINKG
jgi:hypothetical protein